MSRSNKEHIAEYAKKYYRKHRKKLVEYRRQWRKKNPTKIAMYLRTYYYSHPDRMYAKQANRRARFTRLILTHYGAVCTHPEAPVNCSKELHLHHTHHDGKIHRQAVGSSQLAMYRFVWNVVKEGYKIDKFGKRWVEEDFAILCSHHNRKEQ
jgi:hypothetical protein